MEKWYALYTQSRAEKKVAKEFENRAIEHYLPLQKTLRQWSDRKKWIELPLLSSYIFVYTYVEKSYYDILNVPGVVCFIEFSGKPVAIPENEIDIIRKVEKSGLPISQIEASKLSEGDPIEIIHGPLKNLKGELIKIKGKEKVMIRLNTIDKNISIDISLEMIRKQKNVE